MRDLGFGARFARRLLPAAAFAMLVLAGLAGASPAEARDRPGTPNDEGLWPCGNPPPAYAPLLCGRFNNTATEVVKIEIEATRNGAPYALDPNTFNCSNIQIVPSDSRYTPYVPSASICYSPTKTYGRKQNDPNWMYLFKTFPVDWNTQYCVHFRARRVSDSVVSEAWSNYACAKTAPQPPSPGKPDFNVSFSGFHADSGRTVPDTMTVSNANTSSANAVDYRLMIAGGAPYDVTWSAVGPSSSTAILTNTTFSVPGQATPPTTHQYRISSGSVTVELCGQNFSGHACTVKQISIPNQAGAPAAATPMPPVADRTFMHGVDMPGNDYSSTPIRGSALECERRCRADGKCLAWTWVKPGVQNAQAMCWLKNAVPASQPNPNTTSGVKAGSAAGR